MVTDVHRCREFRLIKCEWQNVFWCEQRPFLQLKTNQIYFLNTIITSVWLVTGRRARSGQDFVRPNKHSERAHLHTMSNNISKEPSNLINVKAVHERPPFTGAVAVVLQRTNNEWQQHKMSSSLNQVLHIEQTLKHQKFSKLDQFLTKNFNLWWIHSMPLLLSLLRLCTVSL